MPYTARVNIRYVRFIVSLVTTFSIQGTAPMAYGNRGGGICAMEFISYFNTEVPSRPFQLVRSVLCEHPFPKHATSDSDI